MNRKICLVGIVSLFFFQFVSDIYVNINVTKGCGSEDKSAEIARQQEAIQDGIAYVRQCGADILAFNLPITNALPFDEFEEAHAGVSPRILMKDKEFTDEVFRDKPEEFTVVSQAVAGEGLSTIAYGGCKVCAPISNEYFNVGQDYCRRTTDVKPISKLRRIRAFIFGPCTVAGFYVKDSQTIASFLQRRLNDLGQQLDVDFEVVNMGVDSSDNENDFKLMKRAPLNPGDLVVTLNYYSPVCAEIMAANGIGVIETTDRFARPRTCSGRPFLNSGSHLTAVGHEVLATAMVPYLEPPLKKTVASPEVQPTTRPPTEEELLAVQTFEQQNPDFKKYVQDLSSYRLPNAEDLKIGSIVMNANPFTFGHLNLVERALEQVDHLYIFVVEEDKSTFPFADRIKLVKEGVAHLTNVTVLPSGSGIISALTLPEYFSKEDEPDTKIVATFDLTIFGRRIAPDLGIKIRFAGEEPSDQITEQYNRAMNMHLSIMGIKFIVMPRITVDDQVVSASTVRRLLAERDFDGLAKLVPKPTFNYLKTLSS